MRRVIAACALALAGSGASAQSTDAHALPAAMPAEARAAHDWLARQHPSGEDARLEHARNRMRVLHALAATDGEWMDSASAQLRALARGEAPAVVQAYAGALDMLRAKYARWPPRKLGHVREGRRLLDAAVDSAPDDAEVRYVRLISGHYLPFFLRNDEQVEEDGRAVARLLPEQAGRFPAPWSRNLAAFVLELGVARAEDLAELRRVAATGR